MDLPLQGVRVLDLSRVLAGPLAAMVLGDLGAEVLKVEHPARGDDTRAWGIRIGARETTYYYSVNRNKKSVTLDLATPEGAAAVRRLAEGADVLVENFRAGAMERFGLGVEALRAANPRLVWCTISGYDRAGPEAARPGYDLVIQGESGLMSINGEAGRPPLKFGVAAVDMFTGMSAAQAILAALFQAQRTGRGRRIDLALYDCGVMLGAYCALDALATGEDPPRYGNAHPSIVPYGVFEAADGPFVLTVGNDRQFRALCEDVLARPDLAADPRFAGNPVRSRHRAALVAALAAEFAGRARAGILAGLAAAGIPCGEVLGLHEALSHPRSRAMVLGHAHPQAGEVRYLAPPWRFDGARPPASPPPGLGADTGEWRGAGES